MHTGEHSHGPFHLPRPSGASRGRIRGLLHYGLALLLTAAALAITLVFPPSELRPYYYFLPAIAVATGVGGWGPGLLSTLLSSALGLVFVFLPQGEVTEPLHLARYLGFVGICFLVYLLAGNLSRTASELRKARLRFGGIVEISEDAIIAVDEQQNITLFNRGAEKIFGYRPAEILGQPLDLLLPERFRAQHGGHVRAFRASPDVLRPMNERGTIYGRRQDGSEFPAEASISKFEAYGDKVVTVRLRDISERMAAEQTMRQLAAIVEYSEDAIVAEDLQGVVTTWNPGAERMYGYTAAEARGRDARFLLRPDEVSDNVRRAREGFSSTYETVRLRKDGKRIDVAMTVSPIRSRAGEVIGVSTISRDITERRRLEEQLHHSQKMEAVGRLAGGVAHDFNNLLSIIVGYSYLIHSSTDGNEALRNAADQIMSAASKAGSLTRQLLAFSRKQVLRPEVVDLNDILEGLGKMLPRILGEDIDVRMIEGPQLKHLKADPSQLEQVIMNLVVNARDAMPEGGKLTIETANVYFDEDAARHHNVRAGDYVLLAVSDTGHGMDEATRAQIFEPFFTTKEAGKGTGLGLATVYGIVHQSNGYIWVYSEVGHGTTFKIYFPATTAPVAQAHPEGAGELAACGNETILLVEDEAGVRDLLRHVLHDQGYKVLSASSGPEALRVVGQYDGPIDLLLTDVIMPEMRGQQLADELLGRFPQMAVIYMSGYTDNALDHGGVLRQGGTFLQKPFTPDEVLRRVREMLDAAASRQPRRRKAI
jgi:PAS domain S-box-containing protein